MKKPEILHLARERGLGGYQGGRCLDLPGCYALIPPGADADEVMLLAVLEFTAWAHHRPAELLAHAREQLVTTQVLDTGADVGSGESKAFFLHDREPASAAEFPRWANAHDLAFDALDALVRSLPGPLLTHRWEGGRTVQQIVQHVAETELRHGATIGGVRAPRDTDLGAVHRWAQETVCAASPSRTFEGAGEQWSVRRVMRESIWHLRYHQMEVRRAIAALWLR